jgi:hypothetical protein
VRLYEAVLDIETRKVPTPDGFTMPNGEPMRMRWQPFLVGIGTNDGTDWILGEELDEAALYEEIAWLLFKKSVMTVYYSATREFDEMVLKGRFTNARRAHLPEPGPWPHLADLAVEWVNLKHIPKIDRVGDISGKDVPAYWAAGKRAHVISHLKLDLEELRNAVG